MSSKRTTRCLAHLALSVELCDAVDLLSWNALATQSAIALEVAAWHELLDDMDDLERKLQAFITLCDQPRPGEAA